MIRSTTVICVRHKGKTAMAADGQVTMGQTVLKRRPRRSAASDKGDILAGFAGSTSDAFALFARFEAKLEEHRGNLSRAAIELAKDWRMDKALRQLEALLIVADKESVLPHLRHRRRHRARRRRPGHRLGRALRPGRGPGPAPAHRPRGAGRSPRRPSRSAPGICVYTNDTITVEEL